MALVAHGDFAGVGAGSRAAGPLARIQHLIATWLQRARERHELAEMGERELHDMGISKIDAQAEYQKPFWRT